MQSWPNQGQNGADGQNSWDSTFYQSGQFDQGQNWGQALSDPSSFGRSLNPADDAANYLHDPNAILHGYQDNNHAQFDLNQQFGGQDVIDPAFHSIHPDLYPQQGKLAINPDSLHQMGSVQGHQQQPNTQSFSHQDYSAFATESHPQFESPSPQYAQAQIMSQTARQQSHTPVQQFNNVPPGLAHPQGLRQNQHSPAQSQSPYAHGQGFQPPQTNGQSVQFQQYQPPQHQHHQHQQPQQSSPPQQHSNQHGTYPQPNVSHQQPQETFASPKAFSYQQSTSTPATQLFSHPVQSHADVAPSQQLNVRELAPPQIVDSASSTPQSIPAETPPKKRKRTVKPAPAETAIHPSLQTSTPTQVPAPIPAPKPASISASISEPRSSVEPMAELVGKKLDDIDSIPAPTPNAEEIQMLQQFGKRGKAAQAKYPSVKGLPHLAYGTTIKLPGAWNLNFHSSNLTNWSTAPKSYDKLVPLVALPPRSKKAMVPELGYSLPCEIQGRFTNLYRPAFDKIGLDERRIEAQSLLEEFDRSMKSLGKKRPKYTEYPRTFYPAEECKCRDK
jgi:hypothetical protein